MCACIVRPFVAILGGKINDIAEGAGGHGRGQVEGTARWWPVASHMPWCTDGVRMVHSWRIYGVRMVYGSCTDGVPMVYVSIWSGPEKVFRASR